MSMAEYCRDTAQFFSNPYLEFVAKNGKQYEIGPATFQGPCGKRGECYRNATLLAQRDSSLTYVEGKISVYGVPIDHAWCSRGELVTDPTIRGDVSRVTDYFGVPFRTDYVTLACQRNGVYGLLDPYHSRRTLPKLIELGLEEGQQWLIG